MKAMAWHAGGIIILSLIGLASMLLIFVAGSHRYGVLSTVWQSFGIKGLLGISVTAHACSAGLLVDVRRAGQSGLLPLLVFWLLTALPVAFFICLLGARFIHGGD